MRKRHRNRKSIRTKIHNLLDTVGMFLTAFGMFFMFYLLYILMWVFS